MAYQAKTQPTTLSAAAYLDAIDTLKTTITDIVRKSRRLSSHATTGPSR